MYIWADMKKNPKINLSLGNHGGAYMPPPPDSFILKGLHYNGLKGPYVGY